METDKLVLLIQQHNEGGMGVSDPHILATIVPNAHGELPIPRIGEKIALPHTRTGEDVYYRVRDIVYVGQANPNTTHDLRDHTISGVNVFVEPAEKLL